MALSNSFNAAVFTKEDVEALVAPVHNDPYDMAPQYEFGKALEGRVPFPYALFNAAKKEVMRRFDEVLIRKAQENAEAEERKWRAENPNGTQLDEVNDKGLEDARGQVFVLKLIRVNFSNHADYNAYKMGEGGAMTKGEFYKLRDARKKRAAPPVAKFKRSVTA